MYVQFYAISMRYVLFLAVMIVVYRLPPDMRERFNILNYNKEQNFNKEILKAYLKELKIHYLSLFENFAETQRINITVCALLN